MTFAETLTAAGVSDAAILKLGDEEIVTIAALANFTYDQFVGMGIKAGSASILAEKFGKKADAPAPAVQQNSSMPSVVQLVTGRPSDMPLKQLLETVASGERSSEFVQELRRRVSNQSVFVRKQDSDAIDIDATLEVIDFAADGPIPEFWNNVPTEGLDEIVQRRRWANPLNPSEVLPNGHAWLKVNEERRKLAAYARLARLLKGNEDQFQLMEELQRESLKDHPRWGQIQAAYDRAKRNNEPVINQAEAEIVYRTAAPRRNTTIGGRGF